MLRCLMPTVRAVGGRGSTLSSIRATSTSRLASKLTFEGPTRSLCNTVTSPSRPTDAPNSEDTSQPVHSHPTHYEQIASDVCASTGSSKHSSSVADVTVPCVDSPATEATSTVDTRAISVLKAFLSSDNLVSSEPTLHTANTIQSLYRSAQARRQHNALDAADFSTLISLFGSLSLSTPGLPYNSIYAHPFTSAILEKGSVEAHRHYWTLVIWLIRQKLLLHATLSLGDRYYAMRAHLTEMTAMTSQNKQEPPSRTMSHIDRATKHYQSIAKYVSHPDAHLPYFYALIQLPGLANEAFDATCKLITRQSYSSNEFLAYLWQLALLPPSKSAVTARLNFLETLRSRAQRTLAALAHAHAPPLDTLEPLQDTRTPTIDDLLHSFTHAVSCDIRPRSLAHKRSSYLLQWSLEAVICELSPAAGGGDPDPAWTQLRYIAAAQHLSPGELEDLIGMDPGGSWTWKAICVLARLKQLIDVNESEDYYYGRVSGVKPKSLIGPLRALWKHWAGALGTEPTIFHPVYATIVVAFLDLARRSGDEEFVEWSWSFLTQGRLLSNRDVAVEYCVAGAIGNMDVPRLLPAILTHVLPASRSTVLKNVIIRLAPNNLALACTVYSVAEDAGLEVEEDALVALAHKLAEAGRLEEALAFASDVRLQVSLQLDILAVVMQHSCRAAPNFPIRRLFAKISRTVSGLVRSHQTPPAAEEALEESLLVTLTMYRTPRLTSVLNTIHKTWPRFFSHRFLLASAQELIRQRQFQVAMRLLRHIKLDNDGHHSVALSLAQGGADRLASSSLEPYGHAKSRSTSLKTLIRDVSLQHADTRHSNLVETSRSLLRLLQPAEAVFFLKLLTSGSRVSASQLAFDSRGQWAIKADNTAIGNTLIHATLTGGSRRRRTRQLQRMLGTMGRLIREQNFVPDRVTVNILLKGILRCITAVDAQAVRALFDRMIRSGYPAGSKFPPGTTPFGTEVGSGDYFEVPELSSPISHSAHVVPLYKTFINALYTRRDVDGAKTVVGILKELEAAERPHRGQRALIAFRRRRE